MKPIAYAIIFTCVLAGSLLSLRTLSQSHQEKKNSVTQGAISKTLSHKNTPFHNQEYARVLNLYVNHQGLVNYSNLKDKRDDLDRFLYRVATLSPSAYKGWSRKKKFAFWINVYNALILSLILDHYPIQASFLKSRLYPTNSIRQISGAFDKITFPVMQKRMSLDTIENDILRHKFQDPRVHMTLVCAAKSCPHLLREPYQETRIDQQINHQSVNFLTDKNKLRLENHTLYLSPIFKWFGDDFVTRYYSPNFATNLSKKEAAVLNFVSQYVNPKIRKKIQRSTINIRYLKYDWSLNEQ